MKNLGGMRFIKLPKINFEATDYSDSIDWSNIYVTEPSLTMLIKNENCRNVAKKLYIYIMVAFEEFSCQNLFNDADYN